MHVLLIDFNFYEYACCLANALTGHVQVSLLEPTGFEVVADALSPHVEVVHFRMPRLRSPDNLKMLAQLWRTIDQLGPDVVHLLSVNPWFNLGLLFHRPHCLVTTIHDPVKHAGDGSQSGVPQLVRDLVVYRSHGLITHAGALKAIILERFDLPAERVAVVPHGEFSIYRHWNDGTWSEQEGTILFFGRIWPYKGLDYLIAAEPAISQACPNARFVIAGQGENLERYRARMIHPDRFEVLNGYIPRADVPRLFQQSSLVVLPYIEGSQSGVIPLAYAFARPVVATSVGGIPEVVDHGQTGLLVPPRDSDALAKAVINLLQDKDARHRMGQRALEKTQNELSWRTIAHRTVEVYKAVIKC
jgi:glycosyltransferase involved in cell wall biosynthesis